MSSPHRPPRGVLPALHSLPAFSPRGFAGTLGPPGGGGNSGDAASRASCGKDSAVSSLLRLTALRPLRRGARASLHL